MSNEHVTDKKNAHDSKLVNYASWWPIKELVLASCTYCVCLCLLTSQLSFQAIRECGIRRWLFDGWKITQELSVEIRIWLHCSVSGNRNFKQKVFYIYIDFLIVLLFFARSLILDTELGFVKVKVQVNKRWTHFRKHEARYLTKHVAQTTFRGWQC